MPSPTKTKTRLLALVARSRAPASISQVCQDLKVRLNSLGEGKDFEVVDSSAWYRQNFNRCGSWESWVWDTVSGQSYATRKHHFSGFVICDEPLGRANANIVQLALRNERLVLFWQDQEPLRVVLGVKEDDPGQWSIDHAPIGG